MLSYVACRILHAEIAKHIKQLNNCKCPGENGIQAEASPEGNGATLCIVSQVIWEFWNSGIAYELQHMRMDHI